MKKKGFIALASVAIGGAALYFLVKKKKIEEPLEEQEAEEFALKREKSYDVEGLFTRESSTPIVAATTPKGAFPPGTSPSKESGSKLVTNADEGIYVYENLGLVLKLPPAWKVSDDMSPVPNVAMITLQHQQLSDPQQPPGMAPVLILSVEDVSMEGLDLFEFKEKSKATAMQQMYMMTNGMVPPQIVHDGPIEVGSFKLSLQYNMMSPFMQMKVLNYITMEHSLAYVLQFMGAPTIYHQLEKEVNEIAKSIQITKLPFTGPPSQTIVQSKKGEFSISLPVNWIVSNVAKSKKIALVATTPSPTKTETIEVLRSEGPTWTQSELEQLCTEDRGKSMKCSSKDTTLVMKYKNVAGHDVLAVARESFCLKVTPVKVTTSVLKESDVLKVLMSAIPTGPCDKMTYRNCRNSYSFDVKEGSRLVESRVGDNAVTFAPEGVQLDPSSSDATPIFTVRVGDPGSDKECEGSIEQWMTRLKGESQASEVRMQDLRYETINEHKCVSFSQTEMQEVGQGMREEHKAKIIVFVESGKTYMLRWETPGGVWRKYESKLYRLLETFTFVA
jgi:hypothetical protein